MFSNNILTNWGTSSGYDTLLLAWFLGNVGLRPPKKACITAITICLLIICNIILEIFVNIHMMYCPALLKACHLTYFSQSNIMKICKCTSSRFTMMPFPFDCTQAWDDNLGQFWVCVCWIFWQIMHLFWRKVFVYTWYRTFYSLTFSLILAFIYWIGCSRWSKISSRKINFIKKWNCKKKRKFYWSLCIVLFCLF